MLDPQASVEHADEPGCLITMRLDMPDKRQTTSACVKRAITDAWADRKVVLQPHHVSAH